MNTSNVMGLINNAALLLALGLLYDMLRFEDHNGVFSIKQILTGVFIGFLGMAVMMTRWELMPGLVFDTRSVLLSISGLFFGAFPTVIAVVMTAAFRVYSGGIGMWTGVAVIATSGGMGIAWRHLRCKDLDDVSVKELYLLGISVHIAMLLWMFSMPWQAAITAISRIGVPVMLIFPVATVLLGRLLSLRHSRKEFKKALQKSQQELADIFSMSLDMICIGDINHATFLKVNPAFTRILGYSEQELLNRPFLDFIHPDDLEATRKVVTDRLKSGESVVDFTNRNRHKDGTYRWIEWVSHPMPERGVTYAVGHDITERKQGELRLQESEQKFRALFESMNEGVCLHKMVDSGNDYEIIDANPIFEHITGVTREISVGKKASVLYGTGAAPFIDIYREVAENQKPAIFETYFAPMGKHFRVSAFSLEKGKFATVFQDITENKRIENEIRSLNKELEIRVAHRTAELEETNKELEDFVYSVSHDLRAPLRSISGFAEIIDRRHKASLNEEGQHYFDNIIKASRQMGGLIDDLLKFSRLGRKAIKFEAVPLDEVFKSAMETLSDPIKTTAARIIVPQKMPVIQGDLSLTIHLFINLLENALKYRQPDVPPLIDVRVDVEKEFVVVSVADNGIGIDPDYHEKIFNIFQRLHSQAEYPGTGIGLAAVKKAVQIMGGNVRMESEPGKGSIFKIKLLKAITA